jgi:hypothetical protein
MAAGAAGVLVSVEPEEFSKLMTRAKDPLIVVAEGGFGLFGRNYKCPMSDRGLPFFTKSRALLPLPGDAELVNAGRIWVPEASDHPGHESAEASADAR